MALHMITMTHQEAHTLHGHGSKKKREIDSKDKEQDMTERKKHHSLTTVLIARYRELYLQFCQIITFIYPSFLFAFPVTTPLFLAELRRDFPSQISIENPLSLFTVFAVVFDRYSKIFFVIDPMSV